VAFGHINLVGATKGFCGAKIFGMTKTDYFLEIYFDTELLLKN
jgi:hypothetical protein